MERAVSCNTHKIGKRVLPYGLIFPALIFVLIFKIYPVFYCFVRAFQYKGEWSFRTFELLFSNKTFWQALWITIKMNLIMTPLQIVLSFFLALLVNTTVKGVGIFRSLYYLPVTVSMPVAAICWSLMLSYSNGLVNSFLGTFFGITNQGFFTDANQALWCIIILCTWKGCGYWMMFYLAGLKGIDTSIYEAAMMDGAGILQRLWHITIPMVKKTTLFVLVADTSTNILLFAPVQLITNGGPNNSTNVLMYEAYKQAFKYGSYEKGAAMTCVLVLFSLAIILIQFRLMQEKD